VVGFDWRSVTGWSVELSNSEPGEIVCHNDVCPENVVFRDGRAVGLLDFDFAAPGRPMWDVAMAARMWAPMAHPSCRREWPDGLDAARRLGVFAGAYGIQPDDSEAFVDAMLRTHEIGRLFVRRHVEADETAFVEMWRRGGGVARDELDDQWLAENRQLFVVEVAQLLAER
jgi:thiamine kinase-like enzyme